MAIFSLLSSHSTPKPKLFYRLTHHDGELLLHLWEPAPLNSTRVRPFLFGIKYRIQLEQEAQQVLEAYRAFYQIISHSQIEPIPEKVYAHS